MTDKERERLIDRENIVNRKRVSEREILLLYASSTVFFFHL